jgi:hypothetical protein
MAPKPPSNENKGRGTSDPVTNSETNNSSEPYKVGPGHPPKESQFKPGQSGNPKGAKRKKPSVMPDLKASLERALSMKVTLNQGEKKRIMTKHAMGIEQLVNQYAKGDRHARRDVFTYAELLDFDLKARQAVEEALALNYEAILDSYVARRTAATADPKPSPVFAPPELLDDDSED